MFYLDINSVCHHPLLVCRIISIINHIPPLFTISSHYPAIAMMNTITTPSTLSVSTTNTSVVLSSSSSISHIDVLTQMTPEVAVVLASDVVPDPLSSFDMIDVVVTATENNALSTNRKSKLTMLHSIGNIPIGKVGVRSLKQFCTKVGIAGQRSKGKYEVCKAIVSSKSDPCFIELKDRAPPTVKSEGESANTSTSTAKVRVTINRRRLINVLFGDVCRPHLATLGASLCRADLDTGVRIDQVFHELVVGEYNKLGIAAYDDNAFPHLSSGRTVLPSNFQPIDWKKSRESFKALTNEYDICFKNWKLSGFHGDIPTDVTDMTSAADKPFDDFSQKNTSVLYLHQYVYQFPNILSTVTGDLPDHLFFESGDSGDQSQSNRSTRRGGTSRLVEETQESVQSKNRTIEFCVLSETCTNISHAVRELNSERRKLKREFTSDICDGDRKRARNRIDNFVATKKRELLGGDSTDEDLYDAPDSQESILEELYNLEKEIETQSRSLSNCRKTLIEKEKQI